MIAKKGPFRPESGPRFSKSFSAWAMKHDERLNIVGIESRGSDLESLLANAEVHVEDWHGNAVDFKFDDLHSKDLADVGEYFTEWLAEREEAAMEARIDREAGNEEYF